MLQPLGKDVKFNAPAKFSTLTVGFSKLFIYTDSHWDVRLTHSLYILILHVFDSATYLFVFTCLEYMCHEAGASAIAYSPKRQCLISGGRKGYVCILPKLL